MNRRDFLRTAGGAAGGTSALAASGSATAAEEGSGTTTSSGGGGGGGGSASGKPDWGGYMEGANNYDGSTADKRGQDSVTIKVGAGDGLAFGPAAVWVSPGTTVTWEWTGQGGAHNVVSDESDIDSGSPTSEAGHTYEVTFEEGGIRKYHCVPHQSSGMYGAVAVGNDIPTVKPSSGAAKEVDPEDMGVPIQAHFVGIATMLAIGMSLVFTFFLLKYGESSHSKGGSN